MRDGLAPPPQLAAHDVLVVCVRALAVVAVAASGRSDASGPGGEVRLRRSGVHVASSLACRRCIFFYAPTQNRIPSISTVDKVRGTVRKPSFGTFCNRCGTDFFG